MMKKILTVATLAILLLGLASCGGSSDTPEALLTRFEQANNNRDLQALMDLYDPNAREFMSAAMNLVGGALGLGSGAGSAIDSMMPFLSSSFQRYVQANDVFPTVRLTATDVAMNGDNRATITYDETLISPNGEETTSQQTMNAIRVDGTWYIEVSLFPW